METSAAENLSALRRRAAQRTHLSACGPISRRYRKNENSLSPRPSSPILSGRQLLGAKRNNARNAAGCPSALRTQNSSARPDCASRQLRHNPRGSTCPGGFCATKPATLQRILYFARNSMCTGKVMTDLSINNRSHDEKHCRSSAWKARLHRHRGKTR